MADPVVVGRGLAKRVGSNKPFITHDFGTGLGIIVGVFIFTYFVGAVREVWRSGDWGGLLSGKVIFSVGLFVFSFFIPKIIQKIKGE